MTNESTTEADQTLEAATNAFLGNDESSHEQSDEVSTQASDDLFESGTEATEEEDSQDLHKHPRFKQLVEQKNEFKGQLEEAMDYIEQLESENENRSELHTAFLETYEDFEEPAETLRRDAQLADAISKLFDAGDPVIEQALAKVSDFFKSGRVENMKKSQDTNREPSAAEQRLARMVEREWRSEVKDMLSKTNIRPEFHKAIERGVLSGIDYNKEPSADSVRSLAREFIEDQGWSKEFLTGTPQTSQRSGLPSNKSAAPTTSIASKQKSQGSPKSEDEMDARELREHMRRQVAELVGERNDLV